MTALECQLRRVVSLFSYLRLALVCLPCYAYSVLISFSSTATLAHCPIDCSRIAAREGSASTRIGSAIIVLAPQRIFAGTLGCACASLRSRAPTFAQVFDNHSDTGLQLPAARLRTDGLHRHVRERNRVQGAHLCGPVRIEVQHNRLCQRLTT